MEKKLIEQQFAEFQQKQYEEEAKIRFDPKVVTESQNKYKKWNKEKIAQLQVEAKRILTKMSERMALPIDSTEIQELVREYHQYIENYYHVTQEIFLGLGELYVIDPSFAEYFEKISAGLADYISRAMQHYCNYEFKELPTSK